MSEQRFANVMREERERLQKEREAIFNQQQALDDQIEEINRELAAIDAYDIAKSGKDARPARQARAGRAPARTRRGSKRESILKLVREHPDGLSRGEILERIGLKGNKSGEMSVSNALTALTKSSQVVREQGKYRIA